MDSNLYRYRAFISYSQVDRKYAKRLHSALETYRVPKGIKTSVKTSQRLGRFFIDNDEIGASADLGATLRSALEASEYLIVVCSPRSAQSKWVNAEIAHFKDIGRGNRILAVIIDGKPFSNDPNLECFPPTLKSNITHEGVLSVHRTEPLGIDLRKENFKRARIRIAAGLIGISFDDLWQREKRRTLKRYGISAVAISVVVSTIAGLGIQWLAERTRSRAQETEAALNEIRDDVASGQVRTALVRLNQLYSRGVSEQVEEALKTILSWVSTPDELLNEIKAPTFFTNEDQLLFLPINGHPKQLDIYRPYRRVLSSGQREILIFGMDETIAINVDDGSVIDRISNEQIQWNGRAFETSTGLIVVGGRYSGISNSTFREFFLIFSPDQQKLSIFNLQDYWEEDNWGDFRFIHPLAVGNDCRTFGVIRESFPFNNPDALLRISDMFFFSADTQNLSPISSPNSLNDWQLIAPFDEQERLGFPNFSLGNDDFEGAGCVSPTADSQNSSTKSHEITGDIRPIGLNSFWESGSRWEFVGPTEEEYSQNTFSSYPIKDFTSPPCTYEKPCRVQDSLFEDDFYGFSANVPGWTEITRPRGVPTEDMNFDDVDGETVYAGLDIGNAGFTSAWCRLLNEEMVCLEIRTGASTGDELTEIDLRSNTGKFIFYARGAARGFRLYDLSTMRDITPSGAELIASTRWVDFSLDDEKLFLAMNGRLLIFGPSPNSEKWELVEGNGSVQIPALSGNIADEVAGLFVLNETDLVIILKSGIISSFNWQTGDEHWRLSSANIGEISRASISKNRRFAILIGQNGGRLLDTYTGLVLSGILVPPSVMQEDVEMSDCFQKTFVSETGMIEVSCGSGIFTRQLTSFDDALSARLHQILNAGSEPEKIEQQK
jgi:hypothetical protein